MDGTARTPPTPAAHKISINTTHPGTAVPPPPRAGKHTNPTPEPAASASPPSPNGSAEFRVGRRLGTPGPSPPPRLREVAPRRRRRRLLLPAAPELGQPRDRRAPPRPGSQPLRRPARPGSASPRRPRPWLARLPAGLRRPEFTSEVQPRAAGSARRARPPVSAGTSPPPAAAGDERGRGEEGASLRRTGPRLPARRAAAGATYCRR